MALSKQNERAACLKDKLEFKFFFSSPVVWTFVSQGAQIEFACRLAFLFYEHASDTCMRAMCGLGQGVHTGIR